MHNSLATLFFGTLLLTQLPGCGASGRPAGSGMSIEEINKPQSNTELKEKLEEIAKTGIGGSATMGLRTGIEEFESKEVAAELLKELALLEQANNPAQIKAIATRMISKL